MEPWRKPGLQVCSQRYLRVFFSADRPRNNHHWAGEPPGTELLRRWRPRPTLAARLRSLGQHHLASPPCRCCAVFSQLLGSLLAPPLLTGANLIFGSPVDAAGFGHDQPMAVTDTETAGASRVSSRASRSVRTIRVARRGSAGPIAASSRNRVRDDPSSSATRSCAKIAC